MQTIICLIIVGIMICSFDKLTADEHEHQLFKNQNTHNWLINLKRCLLILKLEALMVTKMAIVDDLKGPKHCQLN